jgi:hypothetical protein
LGGIPPALPNCFCNANHFPAVEGCGPQKTSAFENQRDTSESLLLKRAVFRFGREAAIPLESVSTEFAGKGNRSVRLTFLPKGPSAFRETNAMQLELPRAQAWALAEWILNETVMYGPDSNRR